MNLEMWQRAQDLQQGQERWSPALRAMATQGPPLTKKLSTVDIHWWWENQFSTMSLTESIDHTSGQAPPGVVGQHKRNFIVDLLFHFCFVLTFFLIGLLLVYFVGGCCISHFVFIFERGKQARLGG